MKLIKKYDLGGLMTFQPLPLVNAEVPGQAQQQVQQQVQQQKESNIDDNLMKQLVGKGITNDVYALQGQIDEAYNKYEALSDTERNTSYGRSLRKTMSGNNPALINSLLRNQEALARGIENVKTNKAQSAFAVSKDGIAVMDKEDSQIKIIDVNELTNNMDKYEMMSNTNLSNQREINPYLSNTTTAFVALNDATSIESIRDSVLGYLNNLGSNSSQNKGNKFTNGNEASIYESIKGLSNAVNGTYDQSFDVSNKNNKAQIEDALGSIFMYLPDNQKNLLRAEAIAKGYRGEDIDKAVKTFIGLIASSKSINDSSSAITIGLVDEDKIPGAKKGEKAGKTEEFNFTQSLVNNNGTQMDDQRLNIGNNYTMLSAGANYFNTWINSKGEPIHKPTMVSDLDNFSAATDVNNVTVGDVHIKPEQFSQLMYPGGKIINAKFYIKEDAQGKIVPDLDLTNRIEKANIEIAEAKAKGFQAQQIYRSNDIESIVQNGVVIPIAPQREFIVMDVVTNENTVEDKKNSSLYIEDDSSQLENVYEKNFDYENGEKVDSKKRGQNSYTRYFSRDPLIKTRLFALKTGDTSSALFAEKKGLIKDQSVSTFEAKQEANQIIGQTRYSPIMSNPNKPVKGASIDFFK